MQSKETQRTQPTETQRYTNESRIGFVCERTHDAVALLLRGIRIQHTQYEQIKMQSSIQYASSFRIDFKYGQ